MKTAKPIRPIIALLAAAAAITSASAFSPTQYNYESVLSSGHWVKVKVTQNAIHSFTDQQLIDMGFSDPSKVTVYGYGGAAIYTNTFLTTSSNPTTAAAHPEDLPQIYSTRYNGRLFFYGETSTRPGASTVSSSWQQDIRINRYAQEGYYFLTDSQSRRSIPSSQFNYNNTTQVTTHKVAQLIDYNDESPASGGIHFFSKDIVANPDITPTFTLDNPSTDAAAYLSYYAASKISTEQPEFTVTLPDGFTSISSYNGKGERVPNSSTIYSRCMGWQKFYPTTATEGTGSYAFSITPKTTPTYASYDWVFLHYTRDNTFADESQRRMIFTQLQSNSKIIINTDCSTTEVWNVTIPYYVRRFNTYFNSSASQLMLSPDRAYNTSAYPAMHIVVFDYTADDFPTPEIVGEVPNQDLHAMTSPDMLIIASDATLAQAQRLAQSHRDHQGLDVQVVTQEQIFNEFSSGTPTAMAYRWMAKMLYDRDPSKFRYLLLFGPGSYDNAGYTMDRDGRLLTYQAEDYAQACNLTTNYCADTFFGMLNDYTNDDVYSNDLDIAVGRIPTDDPTRAKTIVDKIDSYLAQIPYQPYRDRALLLSDDGDANKHETQTDSVAYILNLKRPEITLTKAYVNLYPLTDSKAVTARNTLVRALTQGQGYVCFTGHAGTDNLTGEDLWARTYVESTDYNNPPVWMLATCDTFCFDHADDGIGERMLYKNPGGAIAIIAAGRTVYADCNFVLSVAMADAYCDAQPGATIGDIFRIARNKANAISPKDTLVNTMCYNLGGDPAIPVAIPGLDVIATEINGTDVTDTTATATLVPCALNTIQGRIADTDGNTDTSFNGRAVISIYDAPTTQATRQTKEADSRDVYLDETLLSEITTTVTNGQFSAQMTLPTAIRPEQTNRISFYAITDDGSSVATGYLKSTTIAQYDPSVALDDSQVPEIVEMYLDSPQFTDGDDTSTDVTLYATITAGATGINNSTGTIGAALSLKLDSQTSYSEAGSALETGLDNTATVKFALNDLQEGRHTLTLSVANVAGRRAQRTIGFNVVGQNVNATLSTEAATARDKAVIDLTHQFTSNPKGRIIIEDANGNTIHSAAVSSFPYTWDLSDLKGKTVADGLYRAYAILSADGNYSSTPKIDIVVIK